MNRRYSHFLLLPSILLLLFAGGCQTLQKQQADIQFDKVLYSYQNTLRWSGVDRAYVYMKPELLEGQSIPTELDNIRVTAYEVMQPPVPLGEGLMKQSVKIFYVLQDRQIERSLLDEQVWEYQPEDKIWYRISPMPDFK